MPKRAKRAVAAAPAVASPQANEAVVPLEGEDFDALCEMLDNGGFWARLSDGEPDNGKEARKFVHKHGTGWINALHPFRDDVLMTPLARACDDSDEWRTISVLLDFGADPNICDSNGMPPLFEMVASGCARLRSIHLMLDAGASPLAEYNGCTVAHVAKELALDNDSDNGELCKMVWEAIEVNKFLN